MEWLIVAVGGGIGAVLRYCMMQFVSYLQYPTFFSTAIVNVIGSFLIGLSANIFVGENLLILFFVVGILGAFTTFSTFAFDIVKMINQKEWLTSLYYILVNLLGGIVFFAIGWNI